MVWVFDKASSAVNSRVGMGPMACISSGKGLSPTSHLCAVLGFYPLSITAYSFSSVAHTLQCLLLGLGRSCKASVFTLLGSHGDNSGTRWLCRKLAKCFLEAGFRELPWPVDSRVSESRAWEGYHILTWIQHSVVVMPTRITL